MANFRLGKIQYGSLTTATSGGNLTLVAGSKQFQIFTGTSAHDLTLPSATTTSSGSGISFTVINASTGAITIKNNGGSTIGTVAAGTSVDVILTDHSTANGVWRIAAFAGSSGGGIGYSGTLSKTADYTVVSGDNGKVINVDSTSSAIAITLPSPSANFVITIKDIAGTSGTNNISILDGVFQDLINSAYTAVSYISDGTNWFKISEFTGAVPGPAGRSVVVGGANGAGTTQTVIDYVLFATMGSAVSFGTLATAVEGNAPAASSTRGISAGGFTGVATNDIFYFTIASGGNGTSFGDLTVARNGIGGCSNSTRGVFATGNAGGVNNTMDYITIATTGNAIDFGDYVTAIDSAKGMASSTRGVFCGGSVGGNDSQTTYNYITIATPSNSTNFGNLVTPVRGNMAFSNSTRGITGGGVNSTTPVSAIEYITIASTGNGTSFGNLAATRNSGHGTASSVRGLFSGGGSGNSLIESVIIATTGNASNFGNLSVGRRDGAGFSNVHGGL